ncbi:hypothetical protein [Sphingobacterium psychroaquaticum]|uniref:Uncharacterized protein n=1 Tax=Sphingobacterium psychroaquaticum TaxID=561061 RepID=A0A1X7HW14_9SPHI|nr:hypothetical protein [Sphingobacterium psychroaquaticum]QBQ42083.1 hypothetical protein E2P86_13355 [Sphingobacterium psychroaquaticum]SMG06107.1 hypothetical protein SAMN05660862_0117 [Sphingobacterium psychroaquaticum]
MIKQCIHTRIKLIIILFGLIPTFFSCGDVYDLNGFDWEADTPLSDSVFNREIIIYNYGDNLPSGHSPLDDMDPMLFSLERFSSINLNYKTTERWDLSFSSIFRSSIGINNGKSRGIGYGSSAVGGIVVLDTPYSKVTHVPENLLFTAPGNVGLDAQGTLSYEMGHAVYTFGGNFVRPDKVSGYDENDPAASKEANLYRHMIYCLSEDLVNKFPKAKNLQGKPLRPRTMIIKTARGNYVKLETISIYKGVTDPLQMRRGYASPMYTFRYTVIRAEEARFGFVLRKPALHVNMSTNTTSVGK